MHEIIAVRVYEWDISIKGYLILVDRLWPRGVKKESIEPFYWAKEITPSTEIRKWFDHKPERFDEFKKKYLEELDNNPEGPKFIEKIKDILKKQDVTLLYGAKDKKYNHVVILKEWIDKNL